MQFNVADEKPQERETENYKKFFLTKNKKNERERERKVDPHKQKLITLYKNEGCKARINVSPLFYIIVELKYLISLLQISKKLFYLEKILIENPFADRPI